MAKYLRNIPGYVQQRPQIVKLYLRPAEISALLGKGKGLGPLKISSKKDHHPSILTLPHYRHMYIYPCKSRQFLYFLQDVY